MANQVTAPAITQQLLATSGNYWQKIVPGGTTRYVQTLTMGSLRSFSYLSHSGNYTYHVIKRHNYKHCPYGVGVGFVYFLQYVNITKSWSS